MRLYNSIFVLFICLLLINNTHAQSNDPVIFKYGTDAVLKSEFERVYSKNNDIKKKKPTDAEIKEYLELYIKFKLKVKEAYMLKMDTNEAFIQELAGYRKQLAQPYLVDNAVTEKLINEAYDRSQYEINASHILINCRKDDLPKDTLIAYKKILEIREKIVNGTISFDSAAKRYSHDPSAQFNMGNLGYFTTFMMIYPFENKAYQNNVGEVSIPFRTQFGYHIIKTIDKRKSLGEIKVAHIMVRFNNENETAAAKLKIDAVYDKLKSGSSFEDMVKQFSEDYQTKGNGGMLSPFVYTTNLPIQFKSAAFSLANNGDYTQPVKSEYGYHIIKRIDLKPQPTLDEMRETLKYKISKDERSQLNNKVVLEKIKRENKFVEIPNALNTSIPFIDTSLLNGNWEPKFDKITNNTLFYIGSKSYQLHDLVKYMADYQTPRKNAKKENIVNEMYNEFVNKSNFAYEEEHLEEKYSDFKYLMQEYRDGMLLFELTDKSVWSKSVEDTLGLKAYYNSNKTKYLYEDRINAAIFTCENKKVATKVKKMLSKNLPDSIILKKINAKNPLMLTINRGKWEKGKNPTTDAITWQKGMYDIASTNNFVFVKVYEIIPSGPKPLTEINGIVTNDYQGYLEETWIATLKNKYPIEVFQEGVNQLFK